MNQQKISLKQLQKGQLKTQKLKYRPDPSQPILKKPKWIRIRASHSSNIQHIKDILRKEKLHTVCEEASCPNLNECFSKKTATFMIMGDVCTRKCPFCDVAHGDPKNLDPDEPKRLAQTIKAIKLKHVVITSVNRDDLPDKGAKHFSDCIGAIRSALPSVIIEILTPDFKNKINESVEIIGKTPPNIFNHNLETVPRLYLKCRPGAKYQQSLKLLKTFKEHHPSITTKSGLMLGLGETQQEVIEVLKDLRDHHCDMIAIGQYLQPSKFHLAVQKFIHPDEFKHIEQIAKALGFKGVASAPLVRSSYQAEMQNQNRTLA